MGFIIAFCCNNALAQSPVLQNSANPTTCGGSEGSITFSGLTPGTAYQVSYTDAGATIGPVTITSNSIGNLTITGLKAGLYTNFIFTAGGNTSQLLTGVILSNPIFIPIFNPIPSFCAGDPAPVLPATSTNGISGSWTPATVDNQNTGTYVFTPAPGTCGLTVSMTIVVKPKVVPTFPFGTSLTICESGSVPVLPNTSTNGITGTWSPAVVDPTHSGTYVFTPTSPGCVTGTSFTVTVNPNIAPNFSFGASASICSGDGVPTLPNTSANGITGTWSPAVVSNTTSGTYTFTPGSGQCALPVTYSVTVHPIITPVFNFGPTLTICSGGTVPSLPGTSANGITGTWSPAVVSNTTSGVYKFISTSDPCAPPVTFTVTVNPVITPTFSFGTALTICKGDGVPALPNTSSNGITGTWSPSIVSNTASGSYLFTSTSDPCAPNVTFTVTVNPVDTPHFSFGTSLTICSGGTVPVLPTTSLNGITGTWNPAIASNTTSGIYKFTSTSDLCAPPVTFTVTVNPIITPSFSFGTFQSVCINTTAPTLPAVSSNGVTGTWSPAVVDNQNSGTYTFTPDAGQCALSATLTYQVNPVPSVTDIRADTTVVDGAVLPAYTFTLVGPGAGVNWKNSNTSVGLTASGAGTVPSFTANNMSDAPVTAVVTATPFINGCLGATQSYKITVIPLNKDVFVPNVFSPNGDGKNDQLFVYGNYIATLEMSIFNQWGERMITITNKNQGWDGRYKGSPQPVGVYVYVLRAEMTDGRKVNMKGSVTLVR
jgi:gliding motility-associated-like protein